MTTSNTKDSILGSLPIENYIGRYVRLKRSGNSFKGLCPFHKEKSPSFTVSPDKGFFHCFGCGKGGDIFRFVMEQEGLSFPEALKILARYAGVPIETSSKKSLSRESRLSEINASVMEKFSGFLHTQEGQPYKDYLLQRGVTEESIRFFQLGASPESWSWLSQAYQGKEKELLLLGLSRKKEKDKPPYDFFRGRIIFPIFTADKQVAGFGGRLLPNKKNQKNTGAKYINSPESVLFKKSRILYGLAQNLSELRSRQEAILAEGYLDVIGLRQAGIAHACAPLGTSMNAEHLRSLSRYVKSVTLLFDGDAAGLQAARRTAELGLQQAALPLSVCLLPPERDPFDICTDDPRQMKTLLEYSIDGADFFLMETMLPGKFQEFYEKQSNKEEGTFQPAAFGKLVQQYYAGGIPNIFPQGMQKRKPLNRLYESLRAFTAATDCRLLLEGAARLLKLDSVELQQEWNKLSSKGSRINREANLPLQGSSEDLSSEENPQPLSTSQQRRFFFCERSLLLEILFEPGLLEHFYDRLSKLKFEDPHSEFLWRHLESRFLSENIWNSENLSSLEVPEQTRAVFSALIVERKIEENAQMSKLGKDSQVLTSLMEDYFLRHSMLENEKNIEEIGAYIPVAKTEEKSRLIEKKGGLIKELSALKSRWRNEAKEGSLSEKNSCRTV